MSALVEAAAMARIVPQKEIEKATKRLAVLDQQVGVGTSLVGSLLGIEKESKKKAKGILAKLRSEQEELRAIATHGQHYKRLNLKPLTWRNKKGYPLLAIFALDSSKFSIVCHDYWMGDETKLRPRLPKALKNCFHDVMELVGKMADDRPNIRLSCRFTGVIPPEIRQKIDMAKSSFKKIFIIAEPKSWKLERTDPDPLVVGWDGYHLWLIAAFDVSPVEEAMLWASGIDGQKTGS